MRSQCCLLGSTYSLSLSAQCAYAGELIRTFPRPNCTKRAPFGLSFVYCITGHGQLNVPRLFTSAVNLETNGNKMLMYIAPCCLPTKRRREATSLCAVASISRRGKGRNAAGHVCLQRRCFQCIQTSKTVDLAEKKGFSRFHLVATTSGPYSTGGGGDLNASLCMQMRCGSDCVDDDVRS